MKTLNKKLLIALACVMSLALSACASGIKLPDDYAYDDFSKYITLGEYKGLEYTKTDLNVSDEEVQAKIDEALSADTETEEIKSGTVKEDSIVNIDYVGSIDGVEFEGGTAQGQELDIANSTYIDGFAEGIVGHEVGETFDLNVTFPEDYGSEELAGKDAVFKTTINFIVKRKASKYTDEWVKENTDYKTKAEYEESIRKELAAEKEKNAEGNEQSQLFEQIASASEVVEYPEKELKLREETIKQTYMDAAEQSGSSFEDYLKNQMGLDAEGFNSMVADSAKNIVKTELILHAIAKNEGIEFTDSGYTEFTEKILEDAGYTKESFEEEQGQKLQEYADQNALYLAYEYKAVMAKVQELAKAK